MKTGMELMMQDGKTIGEILEMKDAEINRLLTENKMLREALQMICDAGVPLADPIERAILDALAKVKP